MKTFAFLLLPLAFAPSAAAQSGRAVSCGCYCGVVLSPPCSDYACQQACGYGGGGGGGEYREPPMQGVGMGRWTKHFGSKWKEGMRNCGSNPLCWTMQSAATGIVLPIGLVVDAPVWVGKGLWFGAKQTGKGLKATGKGIAGIFKRKPKPYAAPAPPPAPPAPEYADKCTAALMAQAKALDEERREAEAFDAAIVKGHADYGLELAKGALEAKMWEKPEWDAPTGEDFDLKLGAVRSKGEPGKRGLLESSDFRERVAAAKEKVGTAKDYAQALRDFHRETRKCLASATGSDTEGFRKCLEAANKLHEKVLDAIGGPAAKNVGAAKDAYRKYVESAWRKSSGLIEEAARCSGS